MIFLVSGFTVVCTVLTILAWGEVGGFRQSVEMDNPSPKVRLQGLALTDDQDLIKQNLAYGVNMNEWRAGMSVK